MRLQDCTVGACAPSPLVGSHSVAYQTRTPRRLTAQVLTGLLLAAPVSGMAASLDISFGEGSTSARVSENRGTLSAYIRLQDYQDARFGDAGTCTVSGTLTHVAEGGTASPGADFDITNGGFEITVYDGEVMPSAVASGVSVGISIIDDDLAEGSEDFQVEVVDLQSSCNFYGGLLAGPARTVTIVGDEGDSQDPVGGTVGDLTGLTASQQSVADSLDSACRAVAAKPADERTAAEQELLALCDDVTASPNAGAALNALGARNARVLGDMNLRHSGVHARSLLGQIAQRRRNRRSLDLGGLTVQGSGGTLSGQLINATGAGDDIQDFGRWGLFFGGTLLLGERDETASEQGYDLDLQNLTAGVDYRFDGGLVAGGAVGYTRADVSLAGDRGDIDQQSANLSAFASYYADDRYHADMLVSYGNSRYDSERRFTVGGSEQTAEAKPDGHDYSAALSAGYYVNHGPLFVRFFGGATYLKAHIDGYTEEPADGGGMGAMLSVDSQTIESATTNLGIELGGSYNTAVAVLLPQASVEWEHQYESGTRTVSGRFVADPTNTKFTLTGDETPDRDYGHAAASLNAVFPRGLSAYLSYRTTFDREDYAFHEFGLGGRLEF